MCYLICLINAIRVIGTVHVNCVAGPVTIVWPYIPPLLCITEWLGAIDQPNGGTLDWILVSHRGSISLTLQDISKYLINIILGRRCFNLKNRQLCLDDGPWLEPWYIVIIGTKLTQQIARFLYCYNPFFDWDIWGDFFMHLRLLQRIMASISNFLLKHYMQKHNNKVR